MTKTVTHIDCPKSWESHNDWDSHRPLLYKAINMVTGAVVEFGCGYGSTELIKEYCTARTRFSVETNKEWADKFKGTLLVDDYLNLNISIKEDGVLFVDCAPAEIRKDIIERYADAAKVIVVHDTEPGAEYVYGMSEVLNSFKYRLDYQPEGKPHTTAVSNFINIEEWVKNES